MVNLIENNKLIAEFMSIDTKGRGLDKRFEGLYYDHENQILIGKLPPYYNSSWDWLMPVVENIENKGYWVEIRSHKDGNRTAIGFYNYNVKPIANVFKEDKLSSVYLAVLEFIKWYNEN